MHDTSTSYPPFYHPKLMLHIASVCLIASILVAAIMVVRNAGFGAGDLRAFIFWSIPLAVGAASINFTRFYGRLHRLLRYLLAVIIGVTIGTLWTLIIRMFLGPWFGAFSFPVLICWVAGGASGMLVAARACGEMKKGFIWRELILVATICLLAIVGTEPLSVWSSNDQKIDVTFIKWTPGPEPLTMQDADDFEDYGLTKEDIGQLEAIGLTGQLNVLSGSRTGKGVKHSRAIIVMQRQLDKPSIDFPQPDGEVVYVQDENNNWYTYPSNVPTIQRHIHLEIPKNKTDVTDYWVDLASGARQGGQAFFW